MLHFELIYSSYQSFTIIVFVNMFSIVFLVHFLHFLLQIYNNFSAIKWHNNKINYSQMYILYVQLYSRSRHNCNGKLDYVLRCLAQVTTQHGRFVHTDRFSTSE